MSLFVNSVFNSFFCLPADTVVTGRCDHEFFTSDDVECFRATDQEVMASGQPRQFVEAVHLRDRTLHVLTVKLPVRKSSGTVYAVCGLSFDVTEAVTQRLGLEQVNSRLLHREQQLLALSLSPAIDTGDLPASLALIVAAATTGLDVARVGVWFWDETRQSLVSAYLKDCRDPGPLLQPQSIRRCDYPQYFAALDAEPVLAAYDACNDPRTAALATDYLRPLGIGAMLDTPIRLAGETVGVICCEHIGGVRHWSDAEASFTAALAETTSRALIAERRRQADTALRNLNLELEARVAQKMRDAQQADAEARQTRQQLHDITDLMPGAVCQMLWHDPERIEFR